MNHLWCRFYQFHPQRRALFSTSHCLSVRLCSRVVFRLAWPAAGCRGCRCCQWSRRWRSRGRRGSVWAPIPSGGRSAGPRLSPRPTTGKQTKEMLILTEFEKWITTLPLEASFYHIQTHTHSPPPTRFPSWAILFNLGLKLTFPVRAPSRRDASSKARRVHRSLTTAAI